MYTRRQTLFYSFLLPIISLKERKTPTLPIFSQFFFFPFFSQEKKERQKRKTKKKKETKRKSEKKKRERDKNPKSERSVLFLCLYF